MERSKELTDLINTLISQRSAASITAMQIVQQARIDYSYLKGKSVKVFGHKPWNIGTIRDFTIKLGRELEDSYLELDIIGPDKRIIVCALDEVEMLT